MLGTLLLLSISFSTSLRVAFLTDLHVGEACNPGPYNGTEDCACIVNDRRAVAKINSLAAIDAVIITGDITSSALPSEWEKAAEILSDLRMPYFPTMGNRACAPCLAISVDR